MPPPDPPLPIRPGHPRRPLLLAVLIAAAFFAAVAPTLRWQDFSGGSENLVVETVLEMRRGGPWLIPTLLDVPRVTKPPLAAWVTAAAVRPDTVARLASRDPAVRDGAFRELAWQVRWPSLLSACCMLLMTYALAVNLGLGRRVGLAAAAACGSTLMFLRFSRAATTDVQLALWVTAANACLGLAFFRGRAWAGYLGAGAALGLAFMSKGPVAFVQTVLPFSLLVGWRAWANGSSGAGDSPRAPQRAAALAGLAVMLLVGLPWYVCVLHRHPGIVRSWGSEVTRVGATDLPADPWYFYLVMFVWVVPWLAWFAAGLWVAGRQAVDPSAARQTDVDRAWRDGTVASLLLVVVPVVVMSFFKDKPERYLLPMFPPAAVLAARAALGWWQLPRGERRDPAGRVVEALHWGTLIILAVVVPLAAPALMKLGGNEPWAAMPSRLALAAAGAVILALGYVLRHRWSGGRAVGAAVAAAAAVMLLLQFPAMRIYAAQAVSDYKPLADAVWAECPDAQVYQFEPTGRTRVRIDLPIYLGRTVRAVRAGDVPQAPSDRPQVVVVPSRYYEKIPAFATPWREFASSAGRKGGWRAYVLPAARAD